MRSDEAWSASQRTKGRGFVEVRDSTVACAHQATALMRVRDHMADYQLYLAAPYTTVSAP